MTEIVKDYVSFVLHPFEDTHVTGIDVFPAFYNRIILYTAAFTFLYQTVPIILSTYYSKWYNKLEPVKKKEMPTYLISFIHHFIIVPIGWMHIYQDYLMIQSGVSIPNDFYALKESTMVPLGCAFLLADIINSALSEAYHGKPLYLIHHVLTIALGVSVVTVAPGSYLRLVPHFFICETTNIFFNLAWVLRAAGWQGNPVVLLFEYLFALSFFPIRIFNLSLVIWVLQIEGSTLGLARFALHPIAAMQYFWFYKICSMIRSRYSTPSSSSSSDSSTRAINNDTNKMHKLTKVDVMEIEQPDGLDRGHDKGKGQGQDRFEKESALPVYVSSGDKKIR